MFWTAIAIFIQLSYLYLDEIFSPGTYHYKPNLTFSILLFEIRNSFIEESLFRGFLQPFLNDHLGFWKGIIIQGFLFSVIHWCWWVFAGELSFGSTLYMWALGMLWGFVRQKSGSIHPTLAAHTVHNLVLGMLL